MPDSPPQQLPASFEPHFQEALAALQRDRVVERVWQRDHTLWAPEPREIADRLGWLDIEPGEEQRQRLASLVDRVRQDGIRHVVLLGMGGSSLGAEALYSSFGPQEGFPRLIVLDTTIPEQVRQARSEIDPVHSLFLVASKSGTTAEVNALFDYFWGEVTGHGSDDPGSHFVAVTDPGTALGTLARERGFREVFENDPNVGGRFSVLTLFGLVPAALAGIDVNRLLARAERGRRACGPQDLAATNPGLGLGAFLGAGANHGRGKVTVLAAERIEAFGLWAEQLIAESTGKIGKGILPIAGEPYADPAAYADDRLFVHLRVESDPDPGAAEQAERLRQAGHPVWEAVLGTPYDLGSQFFSWEMATAVASHLIGVHPFDQPDVESAKKSTRQVLSAWEASGELPAVEAPSDLLAALADPPSYVAILAYLAPDPGIESAVAELRRALLEHRHLATTFGYGPRYLHSTGQLHKGGPPGGLHVELVPRVMADLPIPGRRYGFATLAGAQADGDLLALQAAGRRCVRLTLTDPVDELRALATRVAAS